MNIKFTPIFILRCIWFVIWVVPTAIYCCIFALLYGIMFMSFEKPYGNIIKEFLI